MKQSRRSGVDTISNLPCNVLDGILGCLPLKDAVKTSILSKDWRYKWVTRQQLEFNDEFFHSFSSIQVAKAIIYQVLLLHKGPVLKFILQCPMLTSYPDIDHWMHFLLNKNVQEFTLIIYSDSYHLPSHFSKFQKLRCLQVKRCLTRLPPGFKGFKRLTHLDLENITFAPTTIMNLISGCPLLEELRFVWCQSPDNIEVDAAHLKCFEFSGMSNSICLKNAPMLRTIKMSFDSRVPIDASHVSSNFTKFFHYTPVLQELQLNHHVLEYLTRGGIPGSPLTAFNNVKSLKIGCLLFRDIEAVSGVVYLITSCPKLQELEIGCEAGNDVVEPVMQLLRQAQSNSEGAAKFLRRVHLCMFSGLQMEMEFVKFILVSSPLLEEMLLWNYSCFLVWMVPQLIDELKQFPRASPNIEFTVDKIDIGEETLMEPLVDIEQVA